MVVSSPLCLVQSSLRTGGNTRLAGFEASVLIGQWSALSASSSNPAQANRHCLLEIQCHPIVAGIRVVSAGRRPLTVSTRQSLPWDWQCNQCYTEFGDSFRTSATLTTEHSVSGPPCAESGLPSEHRMPVPSSRQRGRVMHRLCSACATPRWRSRLPGASKHRQLYLRALVGCLVAVNLLLLYLWWSYDSAEKRFFEENYLAMGSGRTSGECNLPIDLSPFDPSIQPYLESLAKQVECEEGHSFRPLTYVDEGGVLRQNGSNYECQYRTLHKHAHNDVDISYGPRTRLDPERGVALVARENYVHVECSGGQYENVHFWYNPQPASASAEGQVSVLVLVVESLSRLNYLRYLNQTRSVFESHLANVFYLEGLTKLADNSFPNMVPLLTGRRLYSGQLHNENYGPYDDWPFIWKQFRSQQYETALVEDYPSFSLFNYESNGFVQSPPTDFYPRPFWLKLFSQHTPLMLSLFPFGISPCYKRRVAKVDIFLDQVHHFVQRCVQRMRKFFAFTFYVELTHDDFNRAQTIDSHLAAFFRRSAHLLNDSIVVLMVSGPGRATLTPSTGRETTATDSGQCCRPRWAEWRRECHCAPYACRTHCCELSPHWPTGWPATDADSPPGSTSTLSSTTCCRVGTTLTSHPSHALSPAGRLSESTSDPNQAVFSPWRQEIPLTRTCQSAFIPDLYCSCDTRVKVDTGHSLATSASEALVRHVNSMLAAVAHLCHPLSLRRTLSAEVSPSVSCAR